MPELLLTRYGQVCIDQISEHTKYDDIRRHSLRVVYECMKKVKSRFNIPPCGLYEVKSDRIYDFRPILSFDDVTAVNVWNVKFTLSEELFMYYKFTPK